MSKVLPSEFQTWDSLYWPENVPRMVRLSEFPAPSTISNPQVSSELSSESQSIDSQKFVKLIDSIASLLVNDEKVKSFAIMDSDPLAVIAGATVSLKTGISVEITNDPTANISANLGISGISNNSPRVHHLHDNNRQLELSQPCMSILFPRGGRAIYSLIELWGAIQSFLVFTDLRSERGVTVLGSIYHEFGFFTAISALACGLPLVMSADVSEIESSLKQTSVLFIGRDIVETLQRDTQNSLVKVLGRFRHSLSYVGVEGPVGSQFTKQLEKVSNVPILQMYGISGRGIVLSNPREFNVHGSMGIPITNVEALIVDVYEGSSASKILKGPGAEGELVIRGDFIFANKSVGDMRQNPVRVNISGQSTEWLGTYMIGKMDENGYFYSEDKSFM